MHHRLPIASPKRLVKCSAVVVTQVVSDEGLAAVFVYALQDFVGGCVSESGKECEEALEDGIGGVGFEDDGVEFGGGCYSGLVRHEAFGDCVDGVEDEEFGYPGASLILLTSRFKWIVLLSAYLLPVIAPLLIPSQCLLLSLLLLLLLVWQLSLLALTKERTWWRFIRTN